MLISQMSAPGNSGFTIQREVVHLKGVARVAGLAYPIDLANVDAGLGWPNVAAVAIAAETGSIHVVAQIDSVSGKVDEMVLAGQVDATSGEAFAVGAFLSINSAGKFIDTIVATGRTVAIALEAATGADETVKIAFRGYGTFGINVA